MNPRPHGRPLWGLLYFQGIYNQGNNTEPLEAVKDVKKKESRMVYHDREPKIKYVHYLIKNGKYSAEFEATDDVQARLITRRIHGKECSHVALFRISGTNRNGDKKLKGIQL